MLDLWSLPGRCNVESIKTTAFSVLSLKQQSKFQRFSDKDYKKRVILYINYVQCEQGCAVQNQTHLKGIECQMKMVSNPWQAGKTN